MELITSRISKSLKLLRRELDLNQRELAERLKVPQQSLANWETGRSVPDKSMWERLCDISKRDLGWFFLDYSEPVEIVRGPEVEAFKAFAKMLGAMGRNNAEPYPRIGTGRTLIPAKHSRPVMRIRTACG